MNSFNKELTGRGMVRRIKGKSIYQITDRFHFFLNIFQRHIELVIQGARNKDICDLLCISENTVKTHLQNIYSKLDVNSKAKLVTFAFQNKISIPPDMATSD